MVGANVLRHRIGTVCFGLHSVGLDLPPPGIYEVAKQSTRSVGDLKDRRVERGLQVSKVGLVGQALPDLGLGILSAFKCLAQSLSGTLRCAEVPNLST